MSEVRILEAGHQYTSTSGQTYRFLTMIGAGGQGAVYQVINDNGAIQALKWIAPTGNIDKETRERLRNHQISIENLIQDMSDGNLDELVTFVLPKEIVFFEGFEGFGYTMEYLSVKRKKAAEQDRPRGKSRDKEVPVIEEDYTYVNLSEYINAIRSGNAKFNFFKTTEIASMIADEMERLNRRSYIYRDLSPSNILINTKYPEDKSDPLLHIIDCDNITRKNSVVSSNVLGTKDYMAPELIKAQNKREKAKPDRYSDWFSLSIILFELFFHTTPFKGRLANTADDGPGNPDEQPIFIFSEKNTLNRPLDSLGVINQEKAGSTARWRNMPLYIRREFERTFTLGILDKNERTKSSVWSLKLHELLGNIFSCPNCTQGQFVYDKFILFREHDLGFCSNCNEPVTPPRIYIKNRVVVLDKERTLVGRYFTHDNTLEKHEICKFYYNHKQEKLEIENVARDLPKLRIHIRQDSNIMCESNLSDKEAKKLLEQGLPVGEKVEIGNFTEIRISHPFHHDWYTIRTDYDDY